MLLGEVDELWGDCWILMLRHDSPRRAASLNPSAQLWSVYKRRKMRPTYRLIWRPLCDQRTSVRVMYSSREI